MRYIKSSVAKWLDYAPHMHPPARSVIFYGSSKATARDARPPPRNSATKHKSLGGECACVRKQVGKRERVAWCTFAAHISRIKYCVSYRCERVCVRLCMCVCRSHAHTFLSRDHGVSRTRSPTTARTTTTTPPKRVRWSRKCTVLTPRCGRRGCGISRRNMRGVVCAGRPLPQTRRACVASVRVYLYDSKHISVSGQSESKWHAQWSGPSKERTSRDAVRLICHTNTHTVSCARIYRYISAHVLLLDR